MRSSTAPSARRRLLALAVTLAAAVASAASLDTNGPESRFTGSSALQTTVLTPATPSVTRSIQVSVPDLDIHGIELSVNAAVLWSGTPPGGAPVVTAVLGPDQGLQYQTDAAVTPNHAEATFSLVPASGALDVAAGQSCTEATGPCVMTFELTLEAMPAVEVVTVQWTAAATFDVDTAQPPITITVTP